MYSSLDFNPAHFTSVGCLYCTVGQWTLGNCVRKRISTTTTKKTSQKYLVIAFQCNQLLNISDDIEGGALKFKKKKLKNLHNSISGVPLNCICHQTFSPSDRKLYTTEWCKSCLCSPADQMLKVLMNCEMAKDLEAARENKEEKSRNE